MLCFATTAPSAPLEAAAEELRPGLVAEYRSLLEPTARLVRVEPKPAFYLDGSSLHPRLPPGPFEATWTGALLVKERGVLRFAAYLGGEMRLEVDGDVVLEGKGSGGSRLQGTKTWTREAGLYRVKLTYRSQTSVPARVQLWWEGESFSREPIPAWRFSHIATELSPAARDDARAALGKRLAGELGCARCHRDAMPGLTEPPPGPALHDVRGRIGREWLMRWLENPEAVHGDARMPALFSADRMGYVERWLTATQLVGADAPGHVEPTGNHRMGRQLFLSVGCVACHFIPDMPRGEQLDLGRTPLRSLAERMTFDGMTSFLQNPHGRYPDERMPRLPLTREQSADVAAYLLLWSPAAVEQKAAPPRDEEIEAVRKRLGVKDASAAGAALLREKRCVKCHVGLGPTEPSSVPIKTLEGCLTGRSGPRFVLNAEQRAALRAYLSIAVHERHPSPFAERQRQLEKAGCVRCHQRDSDKPSPLETASSSLGGAYLQYVPFQRTPRLTNAHQKFTADHILRSVREGVSGLRVERFTFRMPAFGGHAAALEQALAEADGESPTPVEPAPSPPRDPTAASLLGPQLVGFGGYACVSCHLWKGQKFGDPDPGAVATDLLRVPGRIRRDWFERFLEDPSRFHPGTPMPGIFPKGKPALLTSVLDGDAAKQRDVLWHYFALGPEAPSPKPPPPIPVSADESAVVAQIPLHMPDYTLVESVTFLNKTADLIVYDLGEGAIRSVFVGGRMLRHLQSRLRKYVADGKEVPFEAKAPALQLMGGSQPETPQARQFLGYERLGDGMVLRTRVSFASGDVVLRETIRVEGATVARRVRHLVEADGVPKDRKLQLRSLGQVAQGADSVSVVLELPPPRKAAEVERVTLFDPGRIEGSLARPGYRATPYPRPKLSSGEDAVVPVAVAVHPRDGRVFVASMKRGEIFVIREPFAPQANFEDYAGGLFQEAYGLLAEEDGLYVLHRRNLSRLVDKDGRAARCDRVLSLPHGIGDTYDYGYGLVRDKTGAFVYSFAPHANRELPGSGGALRHVPGEKPEEIAFGMRNPVGWITGPEGEIFFTDNQGEWVATNKLCHVVKGRFYGYPNQAQKEHAKKPLSRATIWVPYEWARSINGAAYDNTGGKFGPFAGQVFLAELMYGGAIVRANLEKVNGEYQGACFPFWGKGLLGPVSLAFDPARGPMYVAGITEPGWMAQPDRGALFRIDYTGEMPFEMLSIHVRPRGFKIVFTRPVDLETARRSASYKIEHYRYEYTGAYGSPELDRTPVSVGNVVVAEDGRSVEITLSADLVRDRVYMIGAAGVRSPRGEALVHAIGAYTLNETPQR
jgi:mono/diheme cytochrome c family protein